MYEATNQLSLDSHYCQISSVILCKIGCCTPPIFFTYDTAVVSSIHKRILQFLIFFSFSKAFLKYAFLHHNYRYFLNSNYLTLSGLLVYNLPYFTAGQAALIEPTKLDHCLIGNYFP